MDDIVAVLNSTLRLTTPIAYVTLGAVVLEKSGVNAMAMEGTMLVGAFGAVVGSWFTGSAWLGVLTGILFAVLISLVRSFLCVSHQADQTVSGVGINILASGMTAMLLKVIWNMDGKSDVVTALSDWSIPFVENIPVVGEIIGKQNPLVYLLFPVLIGCCLLLGHTPFGLRLAAVGEHPEVLSSLGLSVYRYRYIATILSGILAGIGGAYLSIGQLSFFTQDMASGRGFMALAACIFGRWTALGGFLGALLFGFAEAVQIRLQSWVQYTQFIRMIPYAVTILVLCGFVRKRSGAPAASGKPYQEQQ
ncbi:MAG TPA: ABC transporter permease [Candidatus Gallacutalibacter pullicola]|uniref:ABC transporter permease n=1 Tax=Candidatus Gallacutalibacter pullicola TaxID=2840830 RepID=A0A9D1J1F2_9FIRM|nr:ABC transporter permease [Candidatus Gallacutalibacter pullicola]